MLFGVAAELMLSITLYRDRVAENGLSIKLRYISRRKDEVNTGYRYTFIAVGLDGKRNIEAIIGGTIGLYKGCQSVRYYSDSAIVVSLFVPDSYSTKYLAQDAFAIKTRR